MRSMSRSGWVVEVGREDGKGFLNDEIEEGGKGAQRRPDEITAQVERLKRIQGTTRFS